MGSIYRRGRIWWIGYSSRGAQRCETSRSTERAKAEELLRERESEAGVRQLVRRPDMVTFGAGIYFLRSPATGLVKIGCSADITERLKSSGTFSPEGFQLVARLPVTRFWWRAERTVHAFLADHRVKGEWFQVTAEQIEAAIKHWVKTCD